MFDGFFWESQTSSPHPFQAPSLAPGSLRQSQLRANAPGPPSRWFCLGLGGFFQLSVTCSHVFLFSFLCVVSRCSLVCVFGLFCFYDRFDLVLVCLVVPTKNKHMPCCEDILVSVYDPLSLSPCSSGRHVELECHFASQNVCHSTSFPSINSLSHLMPSFTWIGLRSLEKTIINP